MSIVSRVLLTSILVLASGCVLTPDGLQEQHAAVQSAGRVYEAPRDARDSPDIPAPATWQDVLARALRVNGDLEQGYFDWKAALAGVSVQATWPNSNLAPSFSYLVSPQNMKAWDRTTLGLGFDPSMSLTLPAKTRAAGRIALDSAREAGERFRAMKFDLQRRVLSAYLDLALTEELIRIEADTRTLLTTLRESAADRAAAGAPMQELFKAMIEQRSIDSDLSGLQAKATTLRSTLNALLARPADAPLVLPTQLPPARSLTANDATLIAAGVEQNPELAALAHQVDGRGDALELARLAYLPDFGPSVSITGSLSKSIGSMVMLPSRLPAIRSAIEESEAMRQAATAALRQARQERTARFIASLYLIRNAEQQTRFYREAILPAAAQLVSSLRSAYGAGTLSFSDLIDSERMLLKTRQESAEVQIDREERIAELEALAGVDIETLQQPAPTASIRSPIQTPGSRP